MPLPRNHFFLSSARSAITGHLCRCSETEHLHRGAVAMVRSAVGAGPELQPSTMGAR